MEMDMDILEQHAIQRREEHAFVQGLNQLLKHIAINMDG
jgi:hypothetical protein